MAVAVALAFVVNAALANYAILRWNQVLGAQRDIAKLLRRYPVFRYPRVTPEEAAEMLRLWEAGVRQVDIATQFGRDPGNIWHVLKRAGAFDVS